MGWNIFTTGPTRNALLVLSTVTHDGRKRNVIMKASTQEGWLRMMSFCTFLVYSTLPS